VSHREAINIEERAYYKLLIATYIIEIEAVIYAGEVKKRLFFEL